LTLICRFAILPRAIVAFPPVSIWERFMARSPTTRSGRAPRASTATRRRAGASGRQGAVKQSAAGKALATGETVTRKAATRKTAGAKTPVGATARAKAIAKAPAKKANGAARRASRVGAGAEHKTRHTMYVCRSCVWTEAQREIDGKRQGIFLIEEIEKRRAKWAYEDKITLRVVFCLGGCLNPCDVGFRSPGKYFLRFNKLTLDDAQALLDFAEMYYDSENGDVASEQRPERLRDNLVVRVPPPPTRR
jgi:predicted metal-binding protein